MRRPLTSQFSAKSLPLALFPYSVSDGSERLCTMDQNEWRESNRPRPFLPFGVLAGGIVNSVRAALSFPSSNNGSICSLRPTSQCESGQCDWFGALLQSLISPAHARSANSKVVDSMHSEFSDADIDPKAKEINAQRFPAVDRIIAIGDVHGDVDAMREALRNAKLINGKDKWVGGKSVLVQVGDQLDRGNREREIYDLLFRLQDSAPVQGGAVHILLGNHEIMNMRQDFRYVTKGGFEDFDRDGGVSKVFGVRQKPQIPIEVQRTIRTLPSVMRARAKSLCSGGPLAMELAERAKVSVIIGDNIFVHGGLNVQHLTYGGRDPRAAVETLEKLNKDTRQFLLGKGKLPMVLRGGSSPVWLRDYSRPSLRNGSTECRMLGDTLKLVRAKRMIVGHTPQSQGINSACGGKVWRIDTGMSAVYGGVPEAIEISRRGGVKVFTPEGVVQGSARYK